MPSLRIRFSGLCIYRLSLTPKQVHVVHALFESKPRDQIGKLPIHTPQLWAESPPTSAPAAIGPAESLCFIRQDKTAERRTAYQYELSPGEVLRTPSANPGLTGSPTATSLGSRHPLDDVGPVPVTVFEVTSGTWGRGPMFKAKWAVTNKSVDLPIWNELEVPYSGNKMVLESNHRSWEFDGSGGDVILWLTSAPKHQHAPRKKGDPATHFKWFYQWCDFKNGAPALVDHPILEEDLPTCAALSGDPPAGGPTNTTFCPDSEYP